MNRHDELENSTMIVNYSERGALYVLAALFLTNLVGYLDRQIITLLVQPLKHDLNLSDGDIGLLLGPAFVLTFASAGLIIGRLVDRVNRRNLLIACVAIWTAGAAGGGLSHRWDQLFVFRMAVGIGEAALIPIALSMIGDSFSPARRGMATGVFTMGVYIGIGLSLILVALALPSIAGLSAQLARHGIAIQPWRLVMAAMLVPGLTACGLLATISEPQRAHVATTPRAWQPVAPEWRARAHILVPHHLAMAATTLSAYALAGWFPTVLIRQFGLDPARAGFFYGIVVAVTGTSSVYLGGRFSDRCQRLGGMRHQILFAIGCTLVAAAALATFPAVRSPWWLMVPAAIAVGALAIVLVIGMVTLSDIATAPVRGRMTSIYFLIVGILGTAGGPAAVGYANDWLGGVHRPIGSIVAGVALAGCICAVGFLLLVLRQSRRLLRPADHP